MRVLIAALMFISMPALSVQLTDCRIVDIEDMASIPITISGLEKSVESLSAISYCHVGSMYDVVNGYEEIINHDEYCHYKILSIDLNERNVLYSIDEEYSHYQVRYKLSHTNCNEYENANFVGISLPTFYKFDEEIPRYKKLVHNLENDVSFIKHLLDSYGFWNKLFDTPYSDFKKIDLSKAYREAGIRVTSIRLNSRMEKDETHEVTIYVDNKYWQLDIRKKPNDMFVLVGISSFLI